MVEYAPLEAISLSDCSIAKPEGLLRPDLSLPELFMGVFAIAGGEWTNAGQVLKTGTADCPDVLIARRGADYV